MVMPAARALLLFRIRLPVPLVPLDTVNITPPELFVSVVPPELTVSVEPPVVLIVSAEVALFSVMPVTFEPMPPDTVTVPVLVPV
jgi:hypothetical protein